MSSLRQPKLLDAKAMGKRIKRHRRTILSWAQKGMIPCQKMNARVILFEEFAVREAMRKRGMV